MLHTAECRMASRGQILASIAPPVVTTRLCLWDVFVSLVRLGQCDTIWMFNPLGQHNIYRAISYNRGCFGMFPSNHGWQITERVTYSVGWTSKEDPIWLWFGIYDVATSWDPSFSTLAETLNSQTRVWTHSRGFSRGPCLLNSWNRSKGRYTQT